MFNQSNLQKGETIVKVLLFLLVTYFTLFNHLDMQTIRLWDESRVALNAYEMHLEGYSIITPFKGEPDMWNLKPPLLIWCQATLMNLFGVNELTVRLPAAIGALMTCIFLMWLGIRHFKSYWYGLFSVIVLVSSKGFVFEHAARTGEYDGILTFFTTFYAIMFFLYSEISDESKRKKYYNWAWFGVTMAVFTKGVAALFIAPGVFVYLLARKQVLPILKMRQTYINLALFLMVILGYYLGREAINPGYLEKVWEFELGGKYSEQSDPNTHFFWFINRFFKINFVNWYLMMFIGIGLAWLLEKPLLKQLTIFSLSIYFSINLVLANSGTQLQWYDMPAYPFVALVAAIALHWIYEALKNYELQFFAKSRGVFATVVVLVLCYPAYIGMLNDVTYLPNRNDKDVRMYDVTYYLRNAMRGRVDLKDYNFCYYDYQPYNTFYIWKLKHEQQKVVHEVKREELKVGDKPIVREHIVKKYIAENFEADTLETYKSVIVYELKSRKIKETKKEKPTNDNKQLNGND